MKRKKLRITQADYLKANRRASRQEEIESHGHPVQGRAMIHKSKKVYDRNRIKRAAIKSDDSSHFFSIDLGEDVGLLHQSCSEELHIPWQELAIPMPLRRFGL